MTSAAEEDGASRMPNTDVTAEGTATVDGAPFGANILPDDHKSPSNVNNSAGIPIAIIGLSCRFPGLASSSSRFWDLLRDGLSGFSEKTDRFNASSFHHPTGHGQRQNVIPTQGGYLLTQDPYDFDAGFFNITAAEAGALDPKQRMALEVSYEAVENAGYDLPRVAGTQTACFMGNAMSDYRDAVARDFANHPRYHITGASEEMISNRVSHALDLRGPSATVATACSSSLVAAHLGCQALRAGEADMALAGGVGLILGPNSTMYLNNVGFLSPGGHSRSFGEDGDGYGRGEGCGVVLMKRLDDALRDGDPVRAVVRASGVNSDGWTQGVTMPSGEAQAQLIRRVYETAGLDYGDTQYVEAHGTGTKAGDPIEARAIHETIGRLGKSRSRDKLWMGSVKSNIGHLEAGAGIASIIKGVLSLENSSIPATINITKLNSSIPFDGWNMAVPTTLMPWPACRVKRMSLNSFGMGGTNSHMVLEEAPARIASRSLRSSSAKKRLFVFSSHDQAASRSVADVLAAHLEHPTTTFRNSEDLANLAHTLATARAGMTWRSAYVAETVDQLREQLCNSDAVKATRAPPSSQAPRIGFIFTGQGAQWARMGLEMLSHRVFGASVAKSGAILKELGCEWDPVTELERDATSSRLAQPAVSQPICTVLQIALIDELRSWGVVPQRVVGHSSGEIAAAYCIGALSHRDALAVAYFRGKASAGLSGRGKKGGMMAVGCSRDEAQALVVESKISGMVTVACVNSPKSITLSGDVDALEEMQKVLDIRGIFARRLKVDVAYHSSHMNLCSAEYGASIADVEPIDTDDLVKPVMISSVTGSEVDAELLGPYYWVRNMVSPVLFCDAVKEMVSPDDEGRLVDTLIEIGPHGALGGPTEQILSHHGIQGVKYTSMLSRGNNAVDTSLELAANLFRSGVPNLQLSSINDDDSLECRILTDLPPYPFNHSTRFRIDSRMQRELLAQPFPTRSILGAPMATLDENERIWRGFVELDNEPWLRDHTIGDTVLFPGAGMISITIEAAIQIATQGRPIRRFQLRDISFLAAMMFPEKLATEVIVCLRPHLLSTNGSTPNAWWEFTVSSCVGPTGQLRKNCSGLLAIDYEEGASETMASQETRLKAAAQIEDYRRVLSECPTACSRETFYDALATSGFRHGEIFQGVSLCHPGSGKTAFEVTVLDLGETFTKCKLERPFLIHGATLDAIFQGSLGATARSDEDPRIGFGKPFIPTSIGRLEISARFPGDVGYAMPGSCRSRRSGFSDFSADITMFDKSLEHVLVSVADFRISELDRNDENIPGGEKGPVIDAAAITSQPVWRVALDPLWQWELRRAVEGIVEKDGVRAGMIELITLAVHQRPAINIIELVLNRDSLAEAVAPQISQDLVSPTQIRYGLVGTGEDVDPTTYAKDVALEQQVVDFRQSDEPVAAQIPSLDLLVIPNHVHQTLIDTNLPDIILDKLLSTANPKAMVLVESSSESTWGSAAMEKNDFRQIVSWAAGSSTLTLFSYHRSPKIFDAITVWPDETPHGKAIKGKHVLLLKGSNKSPTVHELSFLLELFLAGEDCTFSTLKLKDITSEGLKDMVVVSLLELDQPVLPNLSKSDFTRIQTLALSCQRLLWVTRGEDPAFAVVDGLARVVNTETGSAKFQTLRLDPNGDAQIGAVLVSRILEAQITETEFRESAGRLQMSRTFNNSIGNDHVRSHLEDSGRVQGLRPHESNANFKTDPAFKLTIGKPGFFDSLHFEVDDGDSFAEPLADHEIEFEVKAAAINFRDIMGAMGLISIRGLGHEASGIVLRVGAEAAKQWKVGDSISTLTIGSAHATKSRCDHRIAARMPDGMSWAEAASIPMVHATAYYAFVKIAKLRPGQSVLIHGAAGGVGQAAIQLAQHLGLEIYATVGSQDKRQLVMEQYGIPLERIFGSRDISFAAGVMRVTSGRGVDCVLNSLSGELLRISWECVAMFGTFVEIGLRDITDNMRLDMRPFEKCSTFTFLNLNTLYSHDPVTLGDVVDEVFKLLRQGILRTPFPVTEYPVSQVEEAYRTMQQGKHRGKIVLTFTDGTVEAPVMCKANDSLKLDPASTYLIVGGLGGLGRSLALGVFATSGARHLVFISRSGDDKPEAKALIDGLTSRGVDARVYRADVADAAQLAAAIQQCEKEMPLIQGVVQMAMVLQDALFENMTYDEWKAGLAPKVQGTRNLHEYFGPARPLDLFVMCSSTSGLIGNAGQAQYAAGNTYQDELAHYRRSKGLKAVSVNLGMMLDVGVLAESRASYNFKQWEEVLGIREPAFHAVMKSVMVQQEDYPPPQVSIGLGSASLLAAHGLPKVPYLNDPRFAPLSIATSSATNGSKAEGQTASIPARLAAASTPQQAAEVIAEALVQKTADILRIQPSEIDPGRPLYQYGVDSLVALEVRNWISRELKANMCLLEILAAVPIREFAVEVAQKSKLVTESDELS